MHRIDVPVWLKDGKRVCYRGTPVRGADAKTFEVLLGNYARDAKSVFFHRLRSPKIDRDSFRPLNANFGVDSCNAYFVVTPIRDADPKTFRVLDSSLVDGTDLGSHFLQAGFAADEHGVWFASGDGIFRLKNADPHTFVSLGNRFGYDRERVFFERSALPGADRLTWRPWRGVLSVDKESVYHANKKVQGVDRASVWLLQGSGCFIDRSRIYCGTEPVSADWYIENILKYSEQMCAREREGLPTGKLFERALLEGPPPV